MSAYVVPWAEVIEYFQECREQAITELAQAESDRAVWRAQGKVALLDELLNLKEVFASLSEVDKEAPPAVVSEPPRPRVWLTRANYLKGG